MTFSYRYRSAISLVALTALFVGSFVTPAAAEYGPRTGRFLQRDPNGQALVLEPGLRYHGESPTVTVSMAYELQYADGMNFYEFVRSNPPNQTDPAGLFSLADILSSATLNAYVRASLFAQAHPVAAQLTGGVLAAANLYGFIKFQEVRAIVVAQPNAGGFIAGELATLRLATRELLRAGTSIAALGRVSARTRQAALTASANVRAAFASEEHAVRIQISRSRLPDYARHVEEAQAAGHARVLTIDRAGAPARRAAATRGHSRVPGMDLDEYPPAMFREGGAGASVRPIPMSQNRAAGAEIGHQLADVPDGAKVVIDVVP